MGGPPNIKCHSCQWSSFFSVFFLSVTSPGMSVSMTILRQASTTFFTSVPVTPVEANKSLSLDPVLCVSMCVVEWPPG